ncbi:MULTISPECIES: alkene reductase [Herbaspirillum]|uniref:alkene reductase n=2 Tax=Oxalobacteraceae TaxID=75682 RepID=UPI000C0B3771|nr:MULTISPECIES: alkene reductase [Herbaspirillum]MAF05496.1 alkene reductase [Herbaspirillum sp.]MBN9358274.1 alkene reductase [Herbaspirillum huttiense]MBO14157.1 alkene reductase [Herbaspirillum sp.]MEE1634977.1 alkene reductase [Herbaspirillum huttiense NC40101]
MTNANTNAHLHSDLFKPMQLGAVQLQNRIVMAPLTRSRAKAGDVPTELAAEYYAQRAGAGLIIAEATQISPQGKGYAWTPGIYNESHVAGWKKITDAVHAKGGRIFLQLWHVGRISHPDLQPGNALPVAPSAIKPEGNAFTESGFKPFVEPRALDASELPAIVEQYKIAAQLSLQAGFDGVEIHAANGYLLDQFLRDKTNQRTDNYGGSIENRARLLLEVVEAVTSVIPSERVGIRLSPISPANDIADSDPKALFSYVVEQLNRYKLVYLHVVEGATGGPREVEGGFDLQILRDLFKGIYIANNGYDLEMAVKARDRNLADLVAFGRPWIANPDLVERFKAGAPLAEINQATLYGGGAEGYTDYPTLQQS